MFLAIIPNVIRTVLLVVCGAMIGAVINWAIYQFQYFSRRSISPWQSPDSRSNPRRPTDYIPVLGWFGMRRDVAVHSKGFWIRPMLIELAWAVGLPWFYSWQVDAGLTGGVPTAPVWTETWFLVQTVLIALMFVATFIDFDEKMIPDQVTVTGTIFALLVAAFFPWSRLPVVDNALAGKTVNVLHFSSPNDLTTWHQDGFGLTVALLIFAVWYLALLPKWIDWRRGTESVKYIVAGIIRPRRKTSCAIRTTPRGPLRLTKLLTIIWIVGTIATATAWLFLPSLNWTSLFCSIVGMGVGGGLVWAIRIVGSYAMQQEAMGFGDVVLMSMIGAFLGWQSSLLVMFVLAPFSAVFIALAYFAVARKKELPFGPYLCFGAFLLILFWSSIWPMSATGLFALGGKVLGLIGIACLVLMAVMLFGLQWLKYKFIAPNEDE